MNVAELIDHLQRYEPETEVMIAHQPSWPLREIVQTVVAASEVTENDDEDVEEDELDVVYLVAGGHPFDGTPYAPKDLWN